MKKQRKPRSMPKRHPLKEALAQAGVTPAMLAKELGINPLHMDYILLERVSITHKLGKRLLRALAEIRSNRDRGMEKALDILTG